jgi:UDP-GlcNAc:undecaprenyl-phosphate GlcNAc-1-phosphate transferase
MTGIIFVIPNPSWSIVFAGTMLVMLGIIDDRQPIPARLKFVFHIAAATIVVVGDNLYIDDIGIFHEIYTMSSISVLHKIIAVFAIATAINAFNFIDGIDGLSASMALLAMTHINLTFNLLYGSTPPDYAFFGVLFSGALAGFLLFNLQVFNGRKIFLGDSGSMLVGLFVAVALIGASQESGRPGVPPIPASLCLWLIAIPLTDMLGIIVRRTASGRSPMAPDRTHLHHKIIEAGFSPRRTLLILILSAIGAFWLGYALTTFLGEALSIIGFIAFVPGYYFIVLRIRSLREYLR